MSEEVVYLAAPYTCPDPEMLRARVNKVNKKAAELMQQGYVVFSPISHSHPIAEYIGNYQDHNFWLRQDFVMLERVDSLFVYMINGWRESYGVNREINFWRELTGKEPIYIN